MASGAPSWEDYGEMGAMGEMAFVTPSGRKKTRREGRRPQKDRRRRIFEMSYCTLTVFEKDPG